MSRLGGVVVARSPDQLRTVLGSCVGVAIYDPHRKLAGLAHAMLPDAPDESPHQGKFADQAVDNLVTELLAAGARKSALRAKLIGGAAMFGPETDDGLGVRNAAAAEVRLSQHGIKIVARALGGTKGRKMTFDPATGQAEVNIIGEEAQTI